MRALAITGAVATLLLGITPSRTLSEPGTRARGGHAHRAHDLTWWRNRARANRRLYRAEHHRWLAEQAHRRRLTRTLERARTVQAHARSTVDWRGRQIAAAEKIGAAGDAAGTDPWPNCPDPYDHTGATWDDTVACENGGSWLDSPGMFRCGLQFEPRWETVYGRLCP